MAETRIMTTARGKQKFEKVGLVVPGYWLPDDLMDSLRELTDRVIAETLELRPEFLFSPHARWEGQIHVADKARQNSIRGVAH